MSRSQVRRPSGPVDLGTDDSGCPILHVDMDAFFAAVSLRERPDLHGTPVIVGGSGGRGVVLSATYEARALGVHSAMPMARALRLAPRATVLPPDHRLYSAVSREVMAILGEVTPLVEQLSVDEAFLDVGGAVRRLGRPAQVGAHIRERVSAEVGVTCSVGVAPTKFVAKLASTRAKPDGLLVVPADRVLDFLHPLPVGALWGVGERTEEHLRRIGLETVGEVAASPVERLVRSLGRAHGTHLHDLAWGRDPRSVTPGTGEKSIGNEVTFDVDIDDLVALRARLLRLSDQVASRLRASGQRTRTVSIKVRFADFRTVTRSRTLPAATDVGADIYAAARSLFDALVDVPVAIRLVGVRAESLTGDAFRAEQLELGQPAMGRREAEVAIDALRARFGTDAVAPARLLGHADGRRTRDEAP
jgi:DNA polymerase-4